MLALDDAALARLVIGATRVRARERGRLLQDIARKRASTPDRQHARSPGRADGASASATGGANCRADDHVRVERAIAAGSESESAT